MANNINEDNEIMSAIFGYEVNSIIYGKKENVDTFLKEHSELIDIVKRDIDFYIKTINDDKDKVIVIYDECIKWNPHYPLVEAWKELTEKVATHNLDYELLMIANHDAFEDADVYSESSENNKEYLKAKIKTQLNITE